MSKFNGDFYKKLAEIERLQDHLDTVSKTNPRASKREKEAQRDLKTFLKSEIKRLDDNLTLQSVRESKSQARADNFIRNKSGVSYFDPDRDQKVGSFLVDNNKKFIKAKNTTDPIDVKVSKGSVYIRIDHSKGKNKKTKWTRFGKIDE